MDIRYNNLTQSKAFQTLRVMDAYDYNNFSVERMKQYDIAGAGYRYNFAAKAITDEILETLIALGEEQQIIEKYEALVSGEMMNTGEGRMVLHHATRGQMRDAVIKDGRNYHAFYKEQRERIRDFSDKVHSGLIQGSTGKQFDSFVQVGIGGSDLGPRALFLAMEQFVYTVDTNHKKYTARFISNVDPDDMSAQLRDVNPETTLFILVSKSGTTQETLTNEMLAIQWMQAHGITHPKKHIIAVTSETSPLATSSEYLDSFFIDDFIGGRYSVTSAVGVCMFDLALGAKYTDELLQGAYEVDAMVMNADLRNNVVALDALIGVFERNVCGYNYTAVLPYSQAMSRFAAHLQQLDMESNGKQVNRDGGIIDYSTGPVIFGEPGTNGQHSFYQLLHQGTDIVPLQFIGFSKSQTKNDIYFDDSTSQEKLQANLAAQIVAFALGQENDNAHKAFKGKRPSSLLYAETLTPRVLGALLAHFENKVMFQGFLWNINSFDQEGVQLGKLLTNELLQGTPSDVLQTYFNILKK